MKQKIAHITLLVKEYEESIDFYTRTLEFKLKEDTHLSETKRWVVITPPGTEATSLILAKASGKNQIAAIGNQAGGRVFLFLHTDDFRRDYERMKERGVEFIESPRKEAYGTVIVFKDLYGNKWDLIEPINI
jgi:catechol 2,3-dioxygenase-like lactoylglutathione lyase family enzyme